MCMYTNAYMCMRVCLIYIYTYIYSCFVINSKENGMRDNSKRLFVLSYFMLERIVVFNFCNSEYL